MPLFVSNAGILGPSGSGKSTLLNIFGNKIRSRGSLRVESDICSLKNRFPFQKSDVAIIYQQDSFFPMLTVS